MRKLCFILFVTIIIAACTPPSNVSGTKFFIQPVSLKITGASNDSAKIREIFLKAFTDKKIRTVSAEDAKNLSENETRRVATLVFSRKESYRDGEEAMKAMTDKHKYVVNILSVRMELEKKDDSVMIYKAGWSNMPLPINFSRWGISKYREINLANLSYNLRENIYSIVDSILYSKELK